jgi:hypothetical protein
MHKCNLAHTPSDLTVVEEGDIEDASPDLIKQAQALVGSLIWISCRTRPDIAFTVSSVASIATRKPSECVKRCKHLLRYLRGTCDVTLRARPFGDQDCEHERPAQELAEAADRRGLQLPVDLGGLTLHCFGDASFAPGGNRSIGASVCLLGSMPIHWRTARQTLTAESSCEAELITLSETSHISLSLRALLSEMEVATVSILLCDNRATLLLVASASSSSWKSRHTQFRARAVREKQAMGEFICAFTPGTSQVADIGTKALGRVKHREALSMLSMIPSEPTYRQPPRKDVVVTDSFDLDVPEESESTDQTGVEGGTEMRACVAYLPELGFSTLQTETFRGAVAVLTELVKLRSCLAQEARPEPSPECPPCEQEVNSSGFLAGVLFGVASTGAAAIANHYLFAPSAEQVRSVGTMSQCTYTGERFQWRGTSATTAWPELPVEGTVPRSRFQRAKDFVCPRRRRRQN